MTLTLYMHPLASFCWKVMMALEENDTPHVAKIVDFSDPKEAATHLERWPIGKIPLLDDSARGQLIAETSLIIEYLDHHYPGPVPLLPQLFEEAQRARLWDRFHDLYVSQPMQKIVGDRLRPVDKRDAFGVDEAHQMLRTAYAMLEKQFSEFEFGGGSTFSMADCSAFPALFYANTLSPLLPEFPRTSAYLERLMERASARSILKGAQPYFQFYPYKEAVPQRFLG